MAKNKNYKRRSGVVYSTNPDYEYQESGYNQSSIDADKQKLRVTLDRKARKGKAVTLVTGFYGPEDELKALGKLLKSKCGVGGSAKDGEIIIQGDQRKKVIEILLAEGFSNTKQSGG